MAGHVDEWCLNEYEAPEFTAADKSNVRRVLRGGSWDNIRHCAPCSFRDDYLPVHRSRSLIGFRVVCSSPID
jgi:formylglycine-generating enzyme required for sulfatase activity